MSSTTGVNVILAQGSAVSEIQNIRKQVLELGQHAVAQKSEEKKKEDKGKIKPFEKGDRIEIRTEEERREGREQGKKERKGKPSESAPEPSVSHSGSLIDIKV